MAMLDFAKKHRWITGLLAVLIIAGFIWLVFGFFEKEKPHSDNDKATVSESIVFVGGSKDPLRRGDVVFVHGLGGNPIETWQGNDKTFFWPKQLGIEFADVGVWSVAYDASPSAWFGGSMPLLDRSKNVLEQLRLHKLGDRPVIFIGHSLGGLVIKQLLRDAFIQHNPGWEEIGDNTKGVVFLATPHNGSDIPALVNFIDRLVPLTRESVNLRELESNGAQLRDLNYWYRNDVPDREIKTSVFFENKPTYGKWVVNIGDADPGINGVTPIAVQADHFSICKLENADQLVYLSVSDFIAKNLTPTKPLYDISFADFLAAFKSVCKDDQTFQAFKNEHLDQKIKWKATIRKVMPHEKSPGLAISPNASTPASDYVIASFALRHFKKDFQVGDEIEIEGLLSKKTNQLGTILYQCKTK